METRDTTLPELNTAPRRRKRGQTEQNRSRHARYLLLLAVIMTLLVLLIGLLIPDRAFSDTENRNLAQFPALTGASLTDGSWFAGVNSWFNDQFPLRDGWISLRSGWQRLTGLKESGQVLLGKDCLLSVPETPNVPALAETTDAINAFAAAYPTVRMTAMLVPGAAATLPDRVPKGAPTRDQLADVRQTEAALSGVTCIDAATVLSAHTDEYIYYRTDHHWTTLGAYYAFEAAAAQMNLTAPAFTFYPVSTDFQGTLSSRSGCGDYTDTVEIAAPCLDGFYYYVTCGEDGEKCCSMFRSDALSQKDKYTVFFGGNYAKVEICTTAESGRTLLLFKDSYANSFAQFLLPCYDRIIMIDPRYYYGAADSLMNGVTDVMFLYSADTLVVDTSLTDVLTAALSD